MGSQKVSRLVVLCCLMVTAPHIVHAQLGGGGMAPNPGAPMGEEKPKFRDHMHSIEGLPIQRKQGDAIVKNVRVVGNRAVGIHKITAKLQTRKNRFYDYELVLGDVRRLNDMGSFDHVTFKIDEQPDGVEVTYIVNERPMISQVVYHGNRAVGERELSGRCGIAEGDPLSEFSIESGRRRILDYYLSEAQSGRHHIRDRYQGTVPSSTGSMRSPGTDRRQPHGSTIVSEARLKKIINSHGPMAGS